MTAFIVCMRFSASAKTTDCALSNTSSVTSIGRLPKRGFKNRNSKEIVGINVDALNRYEDGAVVTVETMIETGLVSNPRDGVKILGNGEVTKKLTVKANAFSESAKAKIEAAGGTVEVI